MGITVIVKSNILLHILSRKNTTVESPLSRTVLHFNKLQFTLKINYLGTLSHVNFILVVPDIGEIQIYDTF